MASMWYSKEHGGFVRSVPGTNKVIAVGGAEDQAMSDAYRAQQNAFMDANFYDRNKDYSGMFSSMFGDSSGGYSGPNDNWFRALEQRNALREQGIWDNVSRYENRVRYQDPAKQAQLLARNNAIESMYQKGYTVEQIGAHLSGKQNISNVNPGGAEPASSGWNDWKDWSESEGRQSVGSLFESYLKAREDKKNGGN